MMRASATITSKGQVTIPVEIRKHLGVSPSDKVELVIDRNGIVRVQRVKCTIDNLRGILPPLPGATPDLTNEIAGATADAIERRLSRWQDAE